METMWNFVKLGETFRNLLIKVSMKFHMICIFFKFRNSSAGIWDGMVPTEEGSNPALQSTIFCNIIIFSLDTENGHFL